MFRKKARDIKPVDLWVPDYYDRTPESLLLDEMRFSERNYKLASSIGTYVADSMSVYTNPDLVRMLQEQPCVIVLNHLDFTDPVMYGNLSEQLGWRRPRHIAMAELFDARRPRIAKFIASLGGVPLDRAKQLAKEKKAVTHFLRMTDYILSDDGEARPLVLFPEGGINPKPRGYAHKVSQPGEIATRIARRNKVPLVVAGISGTRMGLARGLSPCSDVRVGVAINKVFGHDELPNQVQLHMAMQTSANIAKAVARS